MSGASAACSVQGPVQAACSQRGGGAMCTMPAAQCVRGRVGVASSMLATFCRALGQHTAQCVSVLGLESNTEGSSGAACCVPSRSRDGLGAAVPVQILVGMVRGTPDEHFVSRWVTCWLVLR